MKEAFQIWKTSYLATAAAALGATPTYFWTFSCCFGLTWPNACLLSRMDHFYRYNLHGNNNNDALIPGTKSVGFSYSTRTHLVGRIVRVMDWIYLIFLELKYCLVWFACGGAYQKYHNCYYWLAYSYVRSSTWGSNCVLCRFVEGFCFVLFQAQRWRRRSLEYNLFSIVVCCIYTQLQWPF